MEPAPKQVLHDGTETSGEADAAFLSLSLSPSTSSSSS